MNDELTTGPTLTGGDQSVNCCAKVVAVDAYTTALATTKDCQNLLLPMTNPLTS